MLVLTLTADEAQVLLTLLEFHAGNDEPDEHFPDEPFKRLCAKMGVEVPPDAVDEATNPSNEWDPSKDTHEEYDASFDEK